MDEDEGVFTVDQIAAANTAMRVVLGLPPEHFGLKRFIGMVSDEIEQLRTQGWTDAAIADLLTESTGHAIEAEAVTRYKSGPEKPR